MSEGILACADGRLRTQPITHSFPALTMLGAHPGGGHDSRCHVVQQRESAGVTNISLVLFPAIYLVSSGPVAARCSP